MSPLLLTLPALAQDVDRSRLPQVEAAVQPAYPASELAEGVAATVLLEVLVGDEGQVLDAAVAESAGPAFDAAALDAILGFRFTPALDAQGEPSQAVIGYRLNFEPQAVTVQVPVDAPVPPEPLPELPADEGYTLVVVDQRLAPDITERRLTAEEIRYLPGTSGDVVKAVQNLPGIARAPLGIGQLIVRGNNPEDTLYTLDGSPIPLVFHFAGLTSVVPGDALDEVAFLPGNSSVRYGRMLGGVVDLRTTAELPETSRSVSVDLYQSAAFVTQRLGDRAAITVSARRSYADVVLGPLLSQGDFKVQAPRYWDGQVRYQFQGDGGSWDVMAYASDDRFRFLGGDDDDAEVFAAFADQFQRLRVRRLDAAGTWSRETTLALGPERRFFEFGTDSEAIEETHSASLRQEYVRPLGDRLGARLGVDTLWGRERFDFTAPTFDGSAGEREHDTAIFAAPAGYAELSVRAGPLTFIPGVRADLLAYDTGYTAATIDPRLAVRALVGDSTLLKASVGQYSGFPGLREVTDQADGNPDLGPERSLQASAGIEQTLPYGLRFEATGFHNQLDRLIVGREDRLEFFSGPPPVGPFDTDAYANEGVGRSYGAELMVRYDGERAVGLVTATWSHSERQDRPKEDVELFAYDQPIVLNALWSQELPRGWRLGARFRYGSGNPFTPVVNRTFDAGSRTYAPVYGERSSDRLAAYKSLDVRVDKLWELRRFDLTGFLEVQNATNAKNVEVIGWNEDYSAQDPITGYPTLPVFGVRGDW